jgi:DNA-binding transcriptional MerR regulator
LTTKLYKASEVCELLQVQPFVLRSWEKEFPAIGIQKGADSPRLYRQSDVEHVQPIKQLVFGEGLTVAGARRRLEESAPLVSAVTEAEADEVFEALGDDVRDRIAIVRDGLRALQSLLSSKPGASNGHGRSIMSASRRTQLAAKPAARKAAGRAKASPTRRAAARPKPAKRAATKASPARKKAPAKRKHVRA